MTAAKTRTWKDTWNKKTGNLLGKLVLNSKLFHASNFAELLIKFERYGLGWQYTRIYVFVGKRLGSHGSPRGFVLSIGLAPPPQALRPGLTTGSCCLFTLETMLVIIMCVMIELKLIYNRFQNVVWACDWFCIANDTMLYVCNAFWPQLCGYIFLNYVLECLTPFCSCKILLHVHIVPFITKCLN